MELLRYLPLAPLGLILMLTVLGTLAAAAPALARGERDRAGRRAARTLLGAASSAVLVLTVLGSGGSVGGTNLRPGAGIAAELDNLNRVIGLLNVGGNLLLLLPVGFLLPLALGTRWLTATLLCAAASISVEAGQYLVGRSVDVDDVLLNTTGGALGAVLGVRLLTALASRSGASGPGATPGVSPA